MRGDLARSGQLLADNTDDVIVVVEPRLVSLAVAGAIYGGLSAATISDLQNDEGFPVVRIGRRRLVPVAAADAWFEARQQQGSAAA